MIIYKSKAAKEQFIAHITYLLNLSKNGRNKRSDWQAMKKLFKQHGYRFVKSRRKSGPQGRLRPTKLSRRW